MSPGPHLIAILALLATTAAAQAQPSEEQIFGAAPEPSPSEPQEGEPPPAQPEADAFTTGEAGLVDPLKIGGLLYWRGYAQFNAETSPESGLLSAPTLLDVYFDARPSDRVRGFVLGRLTYDPTRDAYSGLGGLGSTSRSPLPSSASLSIALDQAWLRFDIARKVFITVGQQHVRWGSAHVWNPTDFLTPQRRNPLLTFDPRTGASMIKLHVPYEEKGWNFYALALLDNVARSGFLGDVGGAARAEVLLGEAEVGADAVVQHGYRSRLGLDVSMPLGPLDAYAEAAIQTSSDGPLWRLAATPNASGDLAGRYESYFPEGPTLAASAGLDYTFAYAENQTLTVMAEYFYNSNGYDSPDLYPWLVLKGAYQPFYVGRHYAALFILFPAPWDKNHGAFTLSNLANLSDRSLVSRLDFSLRVLNYMTIETFAAVHYGRAGGEFRLKLDIPGGELDGQVVPALHVPAPLFELGIGARIAI